MGNVTLTRKQLVISLKTYYKWRKRFVSDRGDRQALLDCSRRPQAPQGLLHPVVSKQSVLKVKWNGRFQLSGTTLLHPCVS